MFEQTLSSVLEATGSTDLPDIMCVKMTWGPRVLQYRLDTHKNRKTSAASSLQNGAQHLLTHLLISTEYLDLFTLEAAARFHIQLFLICVCMCNNVHCHSPKALFLRHTKV